MCKQAKIFNSIYDVIFKIITFKVDPFVVINSESPIILGILIDIPELKALLIMNFFYELLYFNDTEIIFESNNVAFDYSNISIGVRMASA
jgi:hypothetical protein